MSPRGGDVPLAQTITPTLSFPYDRTPSLCPTRMLAPYMEEAVPTLKLWSCLEQILSHYASVSL